MGWDCLGTPREEIVEVLSPASTWAAALRSGVGLGQGSHNILDQSLGDGEGMGDREEGPSLETTQHHWQSTLE